MSVFRRQSIRFRSAGLSIKVEGMSVKVEGMSTDINELKQERTSSSKGSATIAEKVD